VSQAMFFQSSDEFLVVGQERNRVLNVAMGHVPRLRRSDFLHKLPTALPRGAVGYPVGAPNGAWSRLDQPGALHPCA
jgi:hypothetical protein